MDRLTERNEYGEAYYRRCYTSPCNGTGENCDNCNLIDVDVCEALAAYEDTGITPDQMREISRLYQARCEELAELKKQFPPCKVGDTVYHYCGDFGVILPYTVSSIRISSFISGGIDIVIEGGVYGEDEVLDDFSESLSDFQKSFFLTESEAEQALNQMRERT